MYTVELSNFGGLGALVDSELLLPLEPLPRLIDDGSYSSLRFISSFRGRGWVQRESENVNIRVEFHEG